MREIQIQLTNDHNAHTGEQTPVDTYIGKLLADAKSGFKETMWETIPTKVPCSPTYKICDVDAGYVSELSRLPAGKFVKYALTTTEIESGRTIYSAIEWICQKSKESTLGDLYTLRCDFLMQQENDTKVIKTLENATEIANAQLTNEFIDALTRAVQGPRKSIWFERQGNDFVVDSFGISESTITVKQDWRTDTDAQYSIKMLKPDGTLILSCIETSKNGDNEAELRHLYHLLDRELPLVSTDVGAKDVAYFIEARAFDSFFDRILEDAIPAICTTKDASSENAVLIYDIFEGVSEANTIRHFLDEVKLRRGPMSEPEYKRLKEMAQAVFRIMRNVHKNPAVVPNTGFHSSIARIANSYTSWAHDVFGENPVMSEATIANRCAVLILAAILADQIP